MCRAMQRTIEESECRHIYKIYIKVIYIKVHTNVEEEIYLENRRGFIDRLEWTLTREIR